MEKNVNFLYKEEMILTIGVIGEIFPPIPRINEHINIKGYYFIVEDVEHHYNKKFINVNVILNK